MNDFYSQKDTVKKMERQATNWQKISDKAFLFTEQNTTQQ